MAQVEMRTCEQTIDAGAIERGSEFVKAVTIGFSVKDSLSLLRLDNIFLKSFDITGLLAFPGPCARTLLLCLCAVASQT